MKKIIFLFIAILTSLIGFSQNLAINPTFVDASDWSDANAGTGQGLVAPADSHTADGSSSYKIVSNGTFNSQIQNSNIAGLTAGDYLFGYWVKGTVGVNTQSQIRDNAANENGVNYTILATDVWEYVEQTVSVSGAGNVSLRIFIKNNVADTAIQVDDVSFTYIPPAGNTLTLNVVGAGDVALDLDKLGYDPSDTETLTATAATHWSFDGWSGDLTGSSNTETLLMDADKTVTATFVTDPSFDYNFLFDSDGDLEGWSLDSQLALASHTGGLVTLTPTTDQWARFSLFDFPIPAASYNKVTITLNNGSTDDDELGIIVNNGSEQTLIPYTMISGADTQVIDLTQFAAWSGDVSQFRIRFADADAGGGTLQTGRSSGTGNITINDIVFEYDHALGTKDFNNANFALYPNPTKGIVNVKGANAVSNIQIFDLSGKKVLETSKLIDNQLDVSSLTSGLYMLRIQDANNNKEVKKLVIQ